MLDEEVLSLCNLYLRLAGREDVQAVHALIPYQGQVVPNRLSRLLEAFSSEHMLWSACRARGHWLEVRISRQHPKGGGEPR
ncbi:hypothetical protein Tter_2092 [Thermobaculum terrenum ATCC BAA-798]|uniref:Uncharacterized protein n=1 Tax=Thermobaculum terrenum (strain ATCC BAA-798 / CCMEE 7001 / YNP1) TaxID=525904 RepID=D1CGX4_THET1|nr:hypothetical protein [Thermobaculum terrenum]ACZ42995.1 hypothetical protein Tter_2092 [Thermobaculum terrenum ATCC BAA-798]